MFFKKNKAKILSLLKGSEFDKYSLKIKELFERNGMQISVEEIENYTDWIFVEDGENVVVAVAIYEIGEFYGSNIYALSNFVSANYRETKLSLGEHRKAISDVFAKAVQFAKKSKNIDYLVQGVNHFDVRASIRAGFNANLLRDPEMSDVVNNLIISIRYIDGYDGTLDQFEDFENYKSYCLRENSVANLNLGSALNRKYESKTSLRMLRALRKNRDFIDKNPAKMAYHGLILGVKTK